MEEEPSSPDATEIQLRLSVSETQAKLLGESLGFSLPNGTGVGVPVVNLGEEAADFSLRAIGTMLELRDFIASGGSVLVQPADGLARRLSLNFGGSQQISLSELPKGRKRGKERPL